MVFVDPPFALLKVASLDRESFTALLGPCSDILRRNQDEYTAKDEAEASSAVASAAAAAATAPPALARQGTLGRRGAVSAEASSAFPPLARVGAESSKKSLDFYRRCEALLSNNILFSSLPKEDRHTLYDAMQTVKVDAGTAIIQQGDDDADLMYVVAEGRCQVFKNHNDGNGDQLMLEYGPGGVFGELALMYGIPRAATVRALTPVKLWTISRMTFRATVLNETKKRREQFSDVLSHVPILQNLDKLERLKIADALDTCNFTDGTVILREGEKAFHFYIILEGQVRVTKNGVETPNSPLEPMQYFGELALLNNEPRAATCTAVGDVRLGSLDRDAFQRLLGPCKAIMNRTPYSAGAVVLRCCLPLSRSCLLAERRSERQQRRARGTSRRRVQRDRRPRRPVQHLGAAHGALAAGHDAGAAALH